MHHNARDGLLAMSGVVVDLHGTKTDIHSNNGGGSRAVGRGKVNIHLPSQHNTSHDNVGVWEAATTQLAKTESLSPGETRPGPLIFNKSQCRIWGGRDWRRVVSKDI